jgi:hypothetical protein
MDATKLPKGKSVERTDGRPVNSPGIYTHQDNGEIFITAEGESGIVQADALLAPVWQGAWVRTGEVPNRLQLLEIRKKQALKDAKAEAEQKKADKAELDAAVAGGETYDPNTELDVQIAEEKAKATK